MNNKKKKINLTVLAVFALYALLGGLCGFLIMWNIDKNLSTDSLFKSELLLLAIMFVWIYVSMFISTILHETGHLLFGILTGYKFLSFRIGKFIFVKIDGKVKLKKYALIGTAGQCLMAPPEPLYGEFPVMLYNLGGVIINLISATVFFIAYVTTHNLLAGAFFLIFAMVNLFSALMNGIPMTVGGINNDGKNALMIRRDKKAMYAFYLQLKMSEKQLQGVRLKDMPEDWFEVHTGDNNTVTSALGVFYCQRLVDSQKFESAIDSIENFLAKTEILEVYRNFLFCDLIYCKLVTGCGRENVENLLTPAQKKFMKIMSTSTSVLRTRFAIALLYDKDEKKAKKILKEFEFVVKKYPYRVDSQSDGELIEIAQKSAEQKIM